MNSQMNPELLKREKIAKVLREFKNGTLKSSSGDKVKKRSQAIAIALSEAKRLLKKGGHK